MSGVFKTVKRVVKKVARSSIGKIAIPILGGLALGPAGLGLASAAGGAAIGSGLGTLASGKGLKDALISGGLTYAGSSIGGKLLPDSVGSQLTSSNSLGPYSFGNLGNTAANSLGNTLANSSIGSIAGGYVGNQYADSMINPAQISGPSNVSDMAPAAPAAFKPVQATQQELPGSLSGLSSLTQDQQSSNLANQGVYGGGLGPEEQSYFQNLINRRLVDQSGNVDQNFNDISPIENSYLSQAGFGGYSNPKDLLEALSKWKA